MISDPVTGDFYHVVDVHQRLSVSEGTGTAVQVADRFEIFDRFGMDQAVLLPPSGALAGEPLMAAGLKARTANVVRTYPDRCLYGTWTVDLMAGRSECH